MRIFAVLCAALSALGLLASARADEKPADSGPDPAALFAELDANKDGVLSADELPDDKKRLFERLVRISDKNKDGKLSAEEFAEGLKPRQLTSGFNSSDDDGQGSKRLFKRIDANSDGKVTLDEVPEERRERFERLIKRGDKDGDGALSQREFIAVISGEEPGKPNQPAEKPPEGKPAESKPAENTPAKAGPAPEQIFKRMDRNGDGKVTVDEVPENRRPMVERLIKRGDKDGDGALCARSSSRRWSGSVRRPASRGSRTRAKPLRPPQYSFRQPADRHREVCSRPSTPTTTASFRARKSRPPRRPFASSTRTATARSRSKRSWPTPASRPANSHISGIQNQAAGPRAASFRAGL